MAASPQWALDLQNLHSGRVARQFVLHFNINDQVIDLSQEEYEHTSSPPRRIRTGDVVGEPLAFRSYLHKFLREKMRCQAIYSYSLAGGLVADEDKEQEGNSPLRREMRGPSWRRIFDTLRQTGPADRSQAGHPAEGREVRDPDLPDSPPELLRLLGHLLRQQHFAPGSKAPGGAQDEQPIAVIIDYAEKLMPVGVADGRSIVEQLAAVEVAQRWAIDPLIRRTRNVVILLTTNMGQLAANISAAGSGARSIRIPFPDEHERLAYIRYLHRLNQQPGRTGLAALREQEFGSTLEEQLTAFTTMTQGMRLSDIDNLNRAIIMRSRSEKRMTEVITQADVQREKEEIIQAQSEQLLEVGKRERGFDEIGGLDKLKTYLRRRSRLMLQRSRSPLVPMGLLLAGPPGTGKTIIAEALAKESGFNFVKMRSIQDRWVGSSERNLELVLNLLKDLYPVVVFIDEIDQAMGRRDTGSNGDSGVSGRMFARILEELSNQANRGRILWIAATNRTDILDSALLRRFDRVVPLLVPDEHETALIYATMPRTINSQQKGNLTQYGGDLAQSGELPPTPRDLACFADIARRTVKSGLTGAGIETVVRRAFEIAEEELLDREGKLDGKAPPVIESRHLHAALDDYKPNHNRDDYDFQSLLALQACNFNSVMPPLPRRQPFTDVLEDASGPSANGSHSANGTAKQETINEARLNQAIGEMRRKLASAR